MKFVEQLVNDVKNNRITTINLSQKYKLQYQEIFNQYPIPHHIRQRLIEIFSTSPENISLSQIIDIPAAPVVLRDRHIF